MSEGIVFPAVPRGTLLAEAERVARLDEAMPQILAAVRGERDPIVVQATLASLLWEALPHASWVGFYRRVAPRELAVGPYQGPMGCVRISFDRGVCGACARTAEPQLVPDVRVFPGHIACDGATLSELVLPVLHGDVVRAVLDLDSHHPAAFSAAERDRLAPFLAEAFPRSIEWPEVAQ